MVYVNILSQNLWIMVIGWEELLTREISIRVKEWSY